MHACIARANVQLALCGMARICLFLLLLPNRFPSWFPLGVDLDLHLEPFPRPIDGAAVVRYDTRSPVMFVSDEPWSASPGELYVFHSSYASLQPLTLDDMRLNEGGKWGSLSLASFEPAFMRPVPPMLPIADSEVRRGTFRRFGVQEDPHYLICTPNFLCGCI